MTSHSTDDQLEGSASNCVSLLTDAGAFLMVQGRYRESLPLDERALTVTEAALGPDHPDTGARLNNLASTLGKLAQQQEALPPQQRARRPDDD